MKNVKRRIRKCIAYGLCVSMLFGISAVPSAAYAEERVQTGVELLTEMCEQEQAEAIIDEATLETQEELNETYEEIESSMTLSETKDSDGIETVYEDAYAGSYIDDDTLVVCMTEQKGEADAYEDAENVECRLVEHSYNDLSALQDSLSDMYTSLYDDYPDGSKEKELLDSIAGFGVDEEYNAVVVDIVELTDARKEVFEELFGVHEEIILRHTAEVLEDCNTYCPGKGIYVITKRVKQSVTYNTLSIGYRAYRKTKDGKQKGFVTAGHGCKDSIDNNVYTSTKFDKVLGKIKKYQYSGSVDAAFVEIDKWHIVGTKAHYANILGATQGGDTIAQNCYMTKVSKGSRVYKVGAITYRTSAAVTNTNWMQLFEGRIFRNLTRTRKFCEKGDSGGLVYAEYKGEYIPAGIIKGITKDSSAYVKATEVISAMDVYPY